MTCRDAYLCCSADLLRYNDEFNNSFKAFENYIQERERRSGRSAHTPTNTFTRQQPPAVASFDNEPALIRFDDDDEPATLTTGFQNMSSSSPTPLPILTRLPPCRYPANIVQTSSTAGTLSVRNDTTH